MHDVWAFTGGCHVNYDCSNYMVDCKECPQLELTRSKKIAHKNLLKKIEIIQKLNITIITPSSWMTAKVRESIVFKNKQVYTIPNALDLSIYKPLGRGYAKNVINTCKSKSLIAFGAISALSDKNKGYETLVEAINILVKHKKDVEVLIFGASMDLDIKVNFDCKVTLINRLSDDISLATIYSAADVVVVPSRQESYSQVTAESIACGTPVVAFNATGPKDIIDHKVNGYLAKPFEAKDLAAGVFWCIENSDRKLLLSKNAREKAVRFCSYEIVAKKHIDVYKKILHE